MSKDENTKVNVEIKKSASDSEKNENAHDDNENVQAVPAEEATIEPPDEITELSEEEKLRIKVAELEDKILRNSAEFENYKKRLVKRTEEQIDYARESLIREILDIVDNLERALEHSGKDSDFEALHQGTEMIYNQFMDLLKRYDIQPIDAVGEVFDPDIHEALMRVASEEFPEGTVAFEINKGYMRGKKVIRHSRVGVSTGEDESQKKKSEPADDN